MAISQLLPKIATAAIENGLSTVGFPIGKVIFVTHGSLPENLAISQLLTNIAIAAIENGVLAVGFPFRDLDFPYPW